MPAITKQINSKTTPPKMTGGIADLIKPISFTESDGISILLYGKSGTGKTALWGTFPGKILAIICSGKKKAGELLTLNSPEYRNKVDAIDLVSVSLVAPLIEHLQSVADRYKTIVLDHVSGLQDLALKEILGLEKIPEQKSWGLATQQQYGLCTAQCKEVLRSLLDLPGKNVVIIGQERTHGGDEDGTSDIQTPTIGVATTPSLAGWLNPTVDYICQTFKRAKMIEKQTKVGDKTISTFVRGKGVDWCLRTEPHDVFTTKFRSPKGMPIPDVIVDPSYEKIMKAIRGEKVT